MDQQDRTWRDRQPPHTIGATLQTLPPPPLPAPSPRAAGYLIPDPTPAELDPAGYVQPDEALAKSAKRFHEIDWPNREKREAKAEPGTIVELELAA